MSNQTVELGDRVKDRVTGFTGIVVVRSVWLNGCVRLGVQAEKHKDDGTNPDPIHFDEAQAEVVDKGAVKLATYVDPSKFSEDRPANAAPGGPRREGQGFAGPF
jgi:hypothetical protein